MAAHAHTNTLRAQAKDYNPAGAGQFQTPAGIAVQVRGGPRWLQGEGGNGKAALRAVSCDKSQRDYSGS